MPLVPECLSRLLMPLDPEAFFARCWAREHLHLAGREGRFEDWLTTRDLDLFFQSEQLPALFVNVASDGTTVPMEQWARFHSTFRGQELTVDTERLLGRYLQGDTLILNSAHLSISSLGQACRLLAAEIHASVWANVYVTPPQSRGFALHQDDHEVFILQIAGSKNWTVYRDSKSPEEIPLQPGSMLYLPRHTLHEARSESAASIHVTLGVRPTYAFDLVSELASAASSDPEFQRPAPGPLASAAALRKFEQEFTERTRALLERTSTKSLLWRRFLARVETQPTGWPGRLSDLTNLGALGPDSMIRLRPGIIWSIEEEGGSLIVNFAGKKIGIPVWFRQALDQMTSGTPFAVRELGGLITEEGKRELVESLIRSGLLSFYYGAENAVFK